MFHNLGLREPGCYPAPDFLAVPATKPMDSRVPRIAIKLLISGGFSS